MAQDVMGTEDGEANVLLVDDDPSVLELLKTILSIRPVHLLTATSLAEAREVLQRLRIDVMLLDLCLPDGNGIGLLKQLQNSDSHPSTIVMTAFGSWESHVKAYNLGAYYFLDKPFRIRQLRVLVDQALRERQKRP
jgi:DNA-binding NtrC family response regulator